MTHPAGTTDTVLGLSISGGEICAHVLDASSGELVAQNRTSAPDRDRLVQILDEVVTAAPGTATTISIASSEPSVQVTLADAGRRVGPEADTLRWLTGATMVSTASALCAVVSQQFPQGGPVVLAILDASGCPTTVDPVMLIDPDTSTVIATAKAFDRSIPVSAPEGAAALAKRYRHSPCSICRSRSSSQPGPAPK